VDLRGLDLPVDPNGLPIHGNLRGAAFAILQLQPGRLRAQLDYSARRDLLAAFPFPHLVEVDARLDARGLRLRTIVTPTGDRAVPISFCWHPYVRLPRAPRKQWTLRWPACRHVAVDDRILPTGVTNAQAAERAPLGRRTFDDHYVLGKDRRFEVAAAGRSLRFTFDRSYPFAQLYVPPRGDFIAIEPMTATIDALGRGEAPSCEPGQKFAATFTIACGK
jgi:galactose mutarotase-like enzyme